METITIGKFIIKSNFKGLIKCLSDITEGEGMNPMEFYIGLGIFCLISLLLELAILGVK